MKLDSQEAKDRDERRAVRYEAEANRLERRMTNHILRNTRRGCVWVSHVTGYLKSRARRLKSIASRARYRPRQREIFSDEGWPDA